MMFSLAGWAAARFLSLWLDSSHEGTHELSVHLRCNRIHVDVLAGKKLASVLNAINSGWLNLNRLEAPRCQFGSVFFLFQGTSPPANPEKHALANLRQHLTMSHNIGHGKAAAWLQHTKGFSQNTVFVRGKVYYAIGDNHIDRTVRQGDVLDLALQELHILSASFALVLVGEREHFVGHV